MATRYNVYFAGQAIPGQELSSVRGKLAKVFNADEQTLDKLFSGTAQLLKRDCDEATARKYQQAMESAGAQPIIKAIDPAPAEEAPSTREMSAAERIAALAASPDQGTYDTSTPPQPTAPPLAGSEQEADGIHLAPSGTAVLLEHERAEPIVRKIDTSNMALDAHAERLSEVPPPPPEAPDTGHLDMSDAGELIPNLPSIAEPVSPNTDAINLSPDGTDFTDCAAPEPSAPALDLSGLDLAPSGSDVLEDKYRKRELAEAPATDHLSLEE